MKFIKTELEGVYILEPKLFGDSRGYFLESFNKKNFEDNISAIDFVQDNESKSKYGVVRGLHFQKPPFDQAKLVRVTRGAVLDVAVDIRKNSKTYGKHIAIELSEENHRQLFIPRGFAHGFSVLTEDVIFQYKCDNFYSPVNEGAILWNDKTLDIDWMIPTDQSIVSEKDLLNPSFDEFISPF